MLKAENQPLYETVHEMSAAEVLLKVIHEDTSWCDRETPTISESACMQMPA